MRCVYRVSVVASRINSTIGSLGYLKATWTTQFPVFKQNKTQPKPDFGLKLSPFFFAFLVLIIQDNIYIYIHHQNPRVQVSEFLEVAA